MSFTGHRKINKPDGSTDDSWETYVCGHCNTKVSGAVVAFYSTEKASGHKLRNKWLPCPNCFHASAKVGTAVFPGSPFGPILQGLPEKINEAYEESRRCMEVNAYTAAELICRKILMHVAVEKGAKEGETFEKYLSHLEGKGYVTPPMKNWVELIRKHGNKATHKLESPDKDRAESTVMFTAELLRLTYEMEYMATQYTTPKTK